MDVLLYFGWAIIITVTIYLLLKIFGVISIPTIEEILVSIIVGHSMIFRIHQTKISLIERWMER
jgi:hypothetical protein